jgi:hypothetical protein
MGIRRRPETLPHRKESAVFEVSNLCFLQTLKIGLNCSTSWIQESFQRDNLETDKPKNSAG